MRDCPGCGTTTPHSLCEPCFGLVEAYSVWSEDCYAAGFIQPSPLMVEYFRNHLSEQRQAEPPAYEIEMLCEFYRQEGVTGAGSDDNKI